MTTEQLKEILDELFKSNEFLNEKDILEFGKTIHNNAVKMCAESAELVESGKEGSCRECGSNLIVNQESILKNLIP